jgi:hypothetical protein
VSNYAWVIRVSKFCQINSKRMALSVVEVEQRREQRAESREQRAESRERVCVCLCVFVCVCMCVYGYVHGLTNSRGARPRLALLCDSASCTIEF